MTASVCPTPLLLCIHTSLGMDKMRKSAWTTTSRRSGLWWYVSIVFGVNQCDGRIVFLGPVNVKRCRRILFSVRNKGDHHGEQLFYKRDGVLVCPEYLSHTGLGPGG